MLCSEIRILKISIAFYWSVCTYIASTLVHLKSASFKNSEKILQALPKIVSEGDIVNAKHLLHYVPNWTSKFNMSYNMTCPPLRDGFKPSHQGREVKRKWTYQCKGEVFLN